MTLGGKFTMNILAVLAHPNRTSFTGALLDEFVTAAESAGHRIDMLDLYAEGFDPRYNLADVEVYAGTAEPSDDVAAQQKRILAADAMALFFPVWWWSMQAILKGWVDRVFTSGFAFTYENGKSVGLLTHKKAALFCPAASDQGLYRRYGYHGAFQRQIDAGIFGYCGITDVETCIFPEIDENAEARARHLAHVREAGLSFETSSGLASDAFR